MKKGRHCLIFSCLMIISILCSFFEGNIVFADSTYTVTTNEYVRLLGRGEMYKGGRSFNYPQSGIEFSFEGTKAEVYVSYTTARSDTLDPQHLNSPYFNISVDGGAPTRIFLVLGWNIIAEGLENGKHTILCIRSSEGHQSKIYMSQIRVDGSSAPAPTTPREKRMEFYGDSYTCGYGNVPIGVANEDYWAINTDHWKSYASFTTRHFNADANVIAMSGRGVCMNYKSFPTIDTNNNMYKQFWLSDIRTGSETHQDWDFMQYTPQVVVVFLGTNDNSNDTVVPTLIEGTSNSQYFYQKYIEFIQLIKQRYPQASIICCSKPSRCYENEVEQAVKYLGGEDNKIYRLIFDNFSAHGVNGHPTASEQEAISTRLISKIESIQGIWNEPESEKITVDYNSNKVNVMGYSGKENQNLSIMVSKGNEDSSIFSDIIYMNQAKTDAFGNYTFDFGTESLVVGNYKVRVSFGDGAEKQSKLLSISVPPVSIKINNLEVAEPDVSVLRGDSLAVTIGVGDGGFSGRLTCAQYKGKTLVKVNSVLVKAEDEKAQIITTVDDADTIKVLFWDTATLKPFIGVYELK